MKIKQLTGFTPGQLIVESGFRDVTGWSKRDVQRMGHEDDAAEPPSRWFKVVDGRMKEKWVYPDHKEQAGYDGWRPDQTMALKHAHIVRSKFHQGKYVKNEGGKWIEVFPFGKPEAPQPEAPQQGLSEMDKSQKGPPGWNISDDEPGGKEHYVKSVKAKEFAKIATKELNKEMNKSHKKTVKETATAGATSAANIGTVDAPHISPGKARGKKSYTGSTTSGSGTKAPPQPKVVQPKKKDGTAVNGLDIKGTSLFGGPKNTTKVIKRR